MTNDTPKFPATNPAISMENIVQRIFEIREQRVMLDADLAVLYGVETGALIRATKRNSDRFAGFMFQLSAEEWTNLKCHFGISSLKSQNATSSSWGGRRHAPYVFTEHGALMLSSVLKSPRATEISRLIIQAFVWLRQTVPAYRELAAKLAEIEATVTRHDSDIDMILEALRQLITPPNKDKRRIGF
ncbi:ORF6N domain-containing protein [Desulfovibrio sp. OttesenSCG-928-F20]|nr:ORF6N domain-containing protein [Desulfovibrio sp. OttesenSCG-928-F20]